ncbi:MAG: HAMP domain-containing sensor histidine kinase [Acidimicrobiales bacterium]
MRLLPRGLRARSATAFALSALVLSITLSVVTYQLGRWFLLDQREDLATRQVTVNALVVKGLVAAGDLGAASGPDGAAERLADSVRSLTNARSVVRVGDIWLATVVQLNEDRIPVGLVDDVGTDEAALQRVRVNGTPYLVVGLALPGVDADYFEFVPLAEYERTLETLLTVLVVGASVTTVLGAGAGWFASRRLLRPLGQVAHVAQAMSAGDLSRRLEVGDDPDLLPVAASFNEMAGSLEARIDRELRFTADVSHELRTPLTAMASAVGLARRSDLSERARFAVDVLDQQVDHLRRLTLELLEISRIDAGVSELELDEVDVPSTALRTMAAAGVDATRLRNELGDHTLHRLDRTRFERVLANLLENADRYGGGATAVELAHDHGDLVVCVDDAGPGVPDDERIAIFGRFHRGNAEQPPGRPKGTGLGLSLVDEHVRLHGGSVGVSDSPWGGARFTVRFPGSAT